MSNFFELKNKYVLKSFFFFLGCLITTLTVFLFLSNYDHPVEAANVLTNPSFTGGTTGWTLTNMAYDTINYQDSAGSVEAHAGRKENIIGTATQNSYSSINSTDTVTLSGYWMVIIGGNGSATLYIEAENQSNPGSWTTLWNTTLQSTGSSWTAINTDVSSNFGTGSYRIRLRAVVDGGAASSTGTYAQFDNMNLDVVSSQAAITVGTTGTQTSSVDASTSNFYIGGAFTFVRDSDSTSVTSITVSETGTIADADIGGLTLYYKQEATCSTSIPVDATQFNSTAGTFTSGSSTVTGTMTVGTSQVCVYAEVDIGSGASADETIEIEITDPSTQVTASAGDVSPSTAVAISGTTTVQVNNPPYFDDFLHDGPINPGDNITFTADTAKEPFFEVSSQELQPYSVNFSADGSNMYIVGGTSDTVFQYSLSTAWDVGTASYANKSHPVGTQASTPTSVSFKPDGSNMYIMDYGSDYAYQYTLSTPWDVSTASYANKSASVTNEETTPETVTFNSDGTSMYTVGNAADTVFQYTLTTAWDISTASYANKSHPVGTEELSPYSVTFSSDGSNMYILGTVTDSVQQYTLSTPWDVSTANYANKSFSVSSQETTPQSVTFNSDGSSMYMVGSIVDTVHQYFLSTNWDISTVAPLSDPDWDTVKLLVCKTAGVSGTSCDGGATDTICTSSLVSSDPSCTYSVPTPTLAETVNIYPYVFDSNNLGSDSSLQGTLHTFTINNVAPVVSNVTINGGSAIDLAAGTTKAVNLTATVTDNNSCTDLSNVTGYTYRSRLQVDWYDVNWDYRVKITTDSTQVDSDLTDYPVYVDLAGLSADFHTYVNQTDARDIRITQADGTTEIPREVVFYDSVTDTGELYFKGNISSSIDTDFYIYYGNASASEYAVDSTYGRNNVWTNGYVAVWHFQESGGTLVDSTGNNDGTATGTSFVTSGKIGGARTFNGISDYIGVSSPVNIPIENSEYSIEAWINPNDPAMDGIVGWGNFGSTNQVNALRTHSTNQITNYWWGNDLYASVPTITTNTWNHIAATFDGTTRSLYFNGQLENSDTPLGHIVPNANNFRIGSTNNAEYFDGEIDELRISNVGHTQGKISASNITFGAQEASTTWASRNEACDSVSKANDNYCYPDITCTVDTGTCTGDTDASADYTCTVNLQYFADPTDTNTQYPDETWESTIKATDNNALSHYAEVSTGVNLNSLMAFNITNEVNYGALGIGESNDPLDRTTVITPTGNIGLDHEVSGPSHMCTDFPTCSGSTIAIEHQKYALSSATAYTSATALSTIATQVATNVPKPTTTSPLGKSIWWGMLVPEGTNNGSYDGTITITGLKSDILNWDYDDWYDSNWPYRVKISTESSLVSAALTDFPVYLDLSLLPTDFHTYVNQTDGRDVRVTTANGITEVPREVVFYDPTTDTGELHFKGDISSTSNTDFYIYYGNSGASELASNSTYGSENVWTEYVAVYHFSESTGDLIDSTASNYDSSSVSVTDRESTGQIGTSYSGTGASDRVSFGDVLDMGNSDMTITTWVKTTQSTQASSASKSYYGAADYRYGIGINSGSLWGFMKGSGGSDITFNGSTAINDGDWHHTGYVFDRSANLELYANGVYDTGADISEWVSQDFQTTFPFELFQYGTGTQLPLDGELDEFRVRLAASSANWIESEHSNQSSPSTFFTIGTQEVQ